MAAPRGSLKLEDRNTMNFFYFTMEYYTITELDHVLVVTNVRRRLHIIPEIFCRS